MSLLRRNRLTMKGSAVNRPTAWGALAARLTAALKPVAPPIGIAFARTDAPALPPPFDARMPAPNQAGRTGAVPAGCVFWMKATERAFATSAADHANCSVGSYTHGFLTLEDPRRATTSRRC